MAIKKITKAKLSQKDIALYYEILKELDERDRRGELVGVSSLPHDVSLVDKIKWDLCREIIIFKSMMGHTSKEMGELMAVDKARTSEILHYKVSKFTLDRLLSCFLGLRGYNKITDQRIEEIVRVFDRKDLAS